MDDLSMNPARMGRLGLRISCSPSPAHGSLAGYQAQNNKKSFYEQKLTASSIATTRGGGNDQIINIQNDARLHVEKIGLALSTG